MRHEDSMKKLLTFLIVAMLAVGAAADDSKIAPELRGLSSTASARVIVQYSQQGDQQVSQQTSLLQPTTSLIGGVL
jgi:hypothetical protein